MQAFEALLVCAPKRWGSFPFGTASTNFSECRRTALEVYLDDYELCYERHGCAERWEGFCTSKVKEWSSVCSHATLDRIQCVVGAYSLPLFPL